jgi:hypothetical protein
MKENNSVKIFFDSYISKTFLTILGVLGTLVTLYAYFIDQKVDLSYEIIANTNVLDFNADINKLEVKYDSTDLKQTHENLRIFTIKIINNGSKDILKELYDDNDLLGIKLSSGKIIEKPVIIKTSNDYLKRNLKVTNYDVTKLNFTKVILESDEFFIIKLLVIHTKGIEPKIQSLGKIAGIKEISVLNAIDVKEENSLFQKIFYGNIWIQISRLIVYFILMLLIIILVLIIASQYDEKKTERKKNKAISDFKKLNDYKYTKMDDAIFDRYKERNLNSLLKIKELIINEENLNTIYTEISEQLKNNTSKKIRIIDSKGEEKEYGTYDWSTINDMISDGIIFKEQDSLKVNQIMKESLIKFIEFINDNAELKDFD